MLFLFLLLSSQSALATEVVLGVGASTQIDVTTSTSIHVANGRTISVSDQGRQLRVTGKKPGMTTITTDSKSYFVTVLDAPRWQAYERIRVASASMRGLEIEIEDSQPTVRGRLLRLKDWISLSEAVGRSGLYTFAAEPDQLIADEVRQHFEKLFRTSGLPIPDMQLTPATIRLSSERKDLAARFERLVSSYGIRVETNSGSLTLEPLVRVQILVTEVRKHMMRRLGIKWPDNYNAQLLPTFIAPGQGSNSVSLQVDALEQNGVARILASPNVLCRSGKEAQFLAGGEFPIKISSRKDAAVIWKRYGVLLKIKPLADFSGRMSIALETEVSTIDPSRTVDGLPGLLTNRIESHFDLKGSRTIALSGLIKQESGNSSVGLPGLGNIPILGNLFASKEFRDEKTELVIFVTPEIVTDPGAD